MGNGSNYAESRILGVNTRKRDRY